MNTEERKGKCQAKMQKQNNDDNGKTSAYKPIIIHSISNLGSKLMGLKQENHFFCSFA